MEEEDSTSIDIFSSTECIKANIENLDDCLTLLDAAVEKRSFSNYRLAFDHLQRVVFGLPNLIEFADAKHDLRNAIGVLQYFAEAGIDSEDVWQEFIEEYEIYKESYLIVRQSLLNPDEVKSVKVRHELNALMRHFAHRVGKGATADVLGDGSTSIQCEREDGVVHLRVDLQTRADGLTNRVVLARAIMNILGNAVDHNPNGDLNVKLFAKDNDQSIDIHVVDDGKGIQDTEKVFERGYTTGVHGENSGIGLSSSLMRLQAIGNVLSVTGEDEDLGGARFTISIPRSA